MPAEQGSANGGELSQPPRPLPVDHPVLAVIAPHRLRRFCERIGVGHAADLDANFTGWSKLVLLADDVAVLVPRDHTHVEPLRREVAMLQVLTELDIPTIPRLREVVDDDQIGPYPIALCERLPGVPLSDVVEGMSTDDLGTLFDVLGRATARWHAVPRSRVSLERRDSLEPALRVSDDLAASPAERRAHEWSVQRARSLEPVVVHGDIHEGQLLVRADDHRRLTGVLDWQTARIDHPFADFDLGEWGTAMWRTHRGVFPTIRRRCWDAYAAERGEEPELGLAVEWFHAASHLARLTGVNAFPVEHVDGVAGTVGEARQALREVLATIARES